VARLREAGLALRQAGYQSAGLRALLGVSGTDIPYTAADLVTYERRIAGAPSSLATVSAVFCLGWAQPADQLVAAMGRLSVDTLITSGALVEADGEFRATVRILPHGDLLLSSDRRPNPGEEAGPLHVTGINAPATLLASLTVRASIARALDLGTGNGIQALLAASHAESVVATDVNPRALAFGAFNAALNDVDTIEFRQGSWFEPVAGERFDLVVSNPPYVISPENDLVYRDSGSEPGTLCGRLVHDVTDYLVNGGFSTMLVSWPLHDDPDTAGESEAPWWSVPASWLGPDGLAWLMMMRREDPLTHASQWNLPLATGRRADDLDGYRDAIERWTRFLADRRIDAVAYGAVIQQRRPGAGRVLRHDQVRSGSGSASQHLLRAFAAPDVLGANLAATVAESTCAIPADARLDATLVPGDGGWTQGEAQLGLAEGVGIRADLDPVMTEVVLGVTGGLTVDAAAEMVADRLGLAGDDRDGLRAAARDMVGELVGLGLLELAAAPTRAESIGPGSG
jgi:hypothetical protein